MYVTITAANVMAAHAHISTPPIWNRVRQRNDSRRITNTENYVKNRIKENHAMHLEIEFLL